MLKEDIFKALDKKIPVYWSNYGYKVTQEKGKLFIEYNDNGYYTGLADSEIKDCFISGGIK